MKIEIIQVAIKKQKDAQFLLRNLKLHTSLDFLGSKFEQLRNLLQHISYICIEKWHLAKILWFWQVLFYPYFTKIPITFMIILRMQLNIFFEF